VQAGAASAFLLHAGNLFAQLGGADGGDIPGGTAADNNEIIFGHKIGKPLSWMEFHARANEIITRGNPPLGRKIAPKMPPTCWKRKIAFLPDPLGPPPVKKA